MNAYHRILKHCLLIFYKTEETEAPPLDTGTEVLAAWEAASEDPERPGALDEILGELRCSGVETGIKSDARSRHYECDEHAIELFDGSTVGFTYWYGGGKYGEPEAIEWARDAYEVESREEVQVVTVYARKEVAE